MYKLQLDAISKQSNSMVFRDVDNTSIPMIVDNTDYQQFKKDIQNGVVLNDAEGNPITGSALTTFIGTLP